MGCVSRGRRFIEKATRIAAVKKKAAEDTEKEIRFEAALRKKDRSKKCSAGEEGRGEEGSR